MFKGFKDVVSYERPSTQSQSAGGNMDSCGEGTLRTTAIMTLVYGQNGWQEIGCFSHCWGRKGKTMRDFWKSLDLPMHFSGVESNSEVCNGYLIRIIPFYLAKFLKGKFN